MLDHQIPCLGFALQEATHVNVWRNRLEEMDLAPGPWLKDVKRAVLAGLPDGTPVVARWRAAGAWAEKTVSLGALRDRALQCVPGEKIAYVSDVAFHAENVRRIVELATDADLLFIEATFREQDAEAARRKFHLTTGQAGTIAREAGVRALVPFHFSPRYTGCEPELRAELQSAYGGPIR